MTCLPKLQEGYNLILIRKRSFFSANLRVCWKIWLWSSSGGCPLFMMTRQRTAASYLVNFEDLDKWISQLCPISLKCFCSGSFEDRQTIQNNVGSPTIAIPMKDTCNT